MPNSSTKVKREEGRVTAPQKQKGDIRKMVRGDQIWQAELWRGALLGAKLGEKFLKKQKRKDQKKKQKKKQKRKDLRIPLTPDF